MSLLIGSIPSNKFVFLEEKINFYKNKLKSTPSPLREKYIAELENLDKFYSFVTTTDPSTPFSLLFFSTSYQENRGVMANLTISLALSLGSHAVYVHNRDLINQLNSFFTSATNYKGTPLKIEETYFKNIYRTNYLNNIYLLRKNAS